jgi:hypothetical protein
LDCCWETADFRGFGHLARLVLGDRRRGFRSGSRTMAKVEALAFSVGFIMTGFLTLVALPLA